MKKCIYFEFKAENLNILIVEDSISIVKIIDSVFPNYGFNTFLSSSLKDARKIIDSNKIDYIILDINLLDGNAYELIKEMSSFQSKIIILTSQTDSQRWNYILGSNNNKSNCR